MRVGFKLGIVIDRLMDNKVDNKSFDGMYYIYMIWYIFFRVKWGLEYEENMGKKC